MIELLAQETAESGLQADSSGLVDMLAKSGVMGIFLVCLFFVAVALFIERWLQFSREATDMDAFSGPFTAAVEERDLEKAARICDEFSDGEGRGNIAEVYRIAVEHYGQGPATLRNVLSSHIELQIVPRLRARMKFLGAIGRGAPMIGLLGTVYGMMRAFVVIAQAEEGANAKQLAGDIGMALGTTFLGLIVAVPIVFGMAALRSRIEQFEIDLEKYSNHVVDLLYSIAPPTGSRTASPAAGGSQGVTPGPPGDGPTGPPQPIKRPS
jgi:biopolymer transport protein ExbB